MASPNADNIDAYFGYDTYDWAMELQRRLRLAQRRYNGIVKKHFGVYDDGLSWRVELFERISIDVDDAFRMVANGQKVDRDQFKIVFELFETASDCVEAEIDGFEAMFGFGLAAAFMPFAKMFPYRELAAELSAYKTALSNLEAALKRAKTEQWEARFDKAIDIAQGIVTFAFPEIALAKEIVMGGGGLLADSILGPQDPDASKIVRTTASTLKEPLAKVTKLSSSMTKVAGVAAKANAVYDVINMDELDQAEANVKALKAAVKAEKEIHKRMIEGIWLKWELRLRNFKISLEKANKALEETKDLVSQYRDALEEQKTLARYKPQGGWRVVQ